MSGLILAALLLAGGCGGTGTNRGRLDDLAGKGLWRDYQDNPILAPGPADSWDAWAVMSMTAVKAGWVFHLYYEGGKTGCPDLQIGHAVSYDGLHWFKDPANPVLRPGKTGRWDDGAVWDPFVIYEDGVFKMWYGGERKGAGDYQCGYAVSADGVNFVKHGRISNFDDGEMADMHVVHDDSSGRYYMFYWDRRFSAEQRLRLAVSPNETDFDFDNARVIRIEGEEAGHRYSHVVRRQEAWHMYYGFDGGPPRSGYAVSENLVDWKVENRNMRETEDAEILSVGDDLHLMFYCPAGMQDEKGCDIRLAIRSGPPGRE